MRSACFYAVARPGEAHKGFGSKRVGKRDLGFGTASFLLLS